MTDFQNLPSPEQMQQVTRIYYHDENIGGTISLSAEQLDDPDTRVRWLKTDNKLLVSHINVVRYVIIPIMEKVTGHRFTEAKVTGNNVTWDRADYSENQKP